MYPPVIGESEGCGCWGVASISDRLRALASSSSSQPLLEAELVSSSKLFSPLRGSITRGGEGGEGGAGGEEGEDEEGGEGRERAR